MDSTPVDWALSFDLLPQPGQRTTWWKMMTTRHRKSNLSASGSMEMRARQRQLGLAIPNGRLILHPPNGPFLIEPPLSAETHHSDIPPRTYNRYKGLTSRMLNA